MGKRIMIMSAMIICVMCLMRTAFATPSTLIWIPSTDIQANDTGHFGADMYAAKEGHPLMDYGLTFGGNNFEYGVDYLYTFGGVSSPVRWNAKYLLKDEAKNMPRLTVGLYDAGGKSASNIGYVLASKTFPLARLTFGYGTGKASVLGDDNNMFFAGIDKSLSDKIWVAADYQSGKSAFGALNAGVAYNFTKSTSLIVGYDWYNNSDLPDTFTAQLDINF